MQAMIGDHLIKLDLFFFGILMNMRYVSGRLLQVTSPVWEEQPAAQAPQPGLSHSTTFPGLLRAPLLLQPRLLGLLRAPLLNGVFSSVFSSVISL